MGHSLNSLKWGYIGDYIGDYYKGHSGTMAHIVGLRVIDSTNFIWGLKDRNPIYR